MFCSSLYLLYVNLDISNSDTTKQRFFDYIRNKVSKVCLVPLLMGQKSQFCEAAVGNLLICLSNSRPSVTLLKDEQ